MSSAEEYDSFYEKCAMKQTEVILWKTTYVQINRYRVHMKNTHWKLQWIAL